MYYILEHFILTLVAELAERSDDIPRLTITTILEKKQTEFYLSLKILHCLFNCRKL